MTTIRVVAGVAPLALRPEMVAFAAAEARDRRAVLDLVSVCPPRQADELHAAAACLQQAHRSIADTQPDVEVVTRVIVGQPEQVLRAEATGADLLVVGADDHSPFVEAITGSVPGGLLTTAPCPMVVVPKDAILAGDTTPILVGVDTAETSRIALDFGFAAAERSGRDLHVVLCWTPPRDRNQRRDESARERRALAIAVAGYGERHPDVTVTELLVDEDPIAELTRRTRHAALLVLGSRGRGRLASMAFGSVSRTLIRSSHCPVTVIRPDLTPATTTTQPAVHTTREGGR